MPATLLDRLLVAVCETEPGADPEDAIGAILDIAAAFLPAAAFGVRAPDPRANAAHPTLVVRRSGGSLPPSSPEEGPMFPELAWESQHPLDFEPEGVLAIGSDDPSAIPEGIASALAARLALAVGAALRVARRVPGASALDPGARSAAEQRDKLAGLGKVVAGVVHELNNPVTSILAYADYLRRKGERGPLDLADLDRIARIEEAARRIHGFSRDLIAYARPSTEIPVRVVIHDVVDRALMFCEHVLVPAGVKIDRAFGDVKPIRATFSQLTQVFVNLFMNAARAMSPTGGTLRIATVIDGEGAVHVTVSDTGAGIAEHAFPRIFEPFFTTNENGDGTGLGLSIVREIVETHRGTVWAERRAGRGAAFHVVLPVAGEDDATGH